MEQKIGKFIKTFRESHKLTQEEFGKIAGVSKGSVSFWERDELSPRMGKLKKISEHFGVPITYIIEGIPPEDSQKKEVDIKDEDLMFALFDGKVTPEAVAKVKEFAKFVKEQEQRENIE